MYHSEATGSDPKLTMFSCLRRCHVQSIWVKKITKTKMGEFTMEQRMMETIQLVSNLMTEKERMLSLACRHQCTNLQVDIAGEGSQW